MPNRRALITSRTRWACTTALALLLTVRGLAAGPSFLWEATGPQGGRLFLGGSIHQLSGEYYPLAPAFEEAFAASDLLVEELDMAEMLAPQSQMQLLTRGMMPAGQKLEAVVSPKTMSGVREKVAELGLPLEPLQLFKPWALALTLQSLEWQKAGFAADLGIDRHFYDRALQRGMQVQGLETLEYQVDQFDQMPMPLQDHMLSEALTELATSKDKVVEMAEAWKSGDAAAVERMVLQELKSEPEMYDRLLVQRNRTWMPKLEALFARAKPAFVVVGAAHLVGSDGLLAMLKARGYSIRQL
ncbi:MAG: TraB/GumN family protein [Vicinamibacterales bacterium]